MAEERRKRTLRMVQCAVFLAMSFVVRIVEQSFPITMGGVNFMKLGLSAPFTLMPAILFGPTYGLIAGALSDLMNLFIPNPVQWIPWLTLTAALKGWMVGLIWKWIKCADYKKVRRGMLVSFSAIGIMGFVNLIVSKFFVNTGYAQIILELNSREKTIPNITTYGFIISALVVFALLFIASKVEEGMGIYSQRRNINNIFLLFMAVLPASIIQTTLNTFILRSMIAQHAEIAFMIYFIPRIAKTLIVGVITVIIINDVLLLLYSKAYPDMYRESMCYNTSRQ
ncbi:MAG: ECF transporter S component [Epulopiscium sp.]|nr:ECF transporter S component [Candidatus Epulonipiscium sp.]